jgi:hypothetical protein
MQRNFYFLLHSNNKNYVLWEPPHWKTLSPHPVEYFNINSLFVLFFIFFIPLPNTSVLNITQNSYITIDDNRLKVLKFGPLLSLYKQKLCQNLRFCRKESKTHSFQITRLLRNHIKHTAQKYWESYGNNFIRVHNDCLAQAISIR